ncbi:rhombosortase [Thalassotalea agarivorans]|uniref:Rhomboid family GlyGly-CTERM serine protease n=1 Tax=Thalassotalea agarivorans TaxID=349064 RepID=A0A1I0BXZ1_THASX|nr:rhombosortase [Thalassotalea agarivorans]SET12043.1 rhomboid family GlyGly-CTERM serine protease [Thalassotalea agarivorans]
MFTFSLKQWPLKKQQCLPPIAIAVIALCFWMFESALYQDLVWDRQSISLGEYWRLVTGHFFHSNTIHLLLNLGALALLWALQGNHYTAKQYFTLVFVSALVIGILMFYFSPSIQRYVGLSGILHGIFVYGAIMDIKARIANGKLLFVCLWIKIAYEQFSEPNKALANLIEANVAIDAHLFGAIVGTIFTLVYLALIHAKKQNK